MTPGRAALTTMWTALALLPRRVLLALVHGYRYLLKPWLGSACRFEPTCSAYALVALQRHGAVKGSALVAGRLLRCHPWCDGGCDPVPDRWPAWGRDAPAAKAAEPHQAGGLFTRLPLSSPEDTPSTRNLP